MFTRKILVQQGTPARMEWMEGRRLMSAVAVNVVPAPAAPAVAEVVNARVSHTGVLRINGTSKDDGIFVTLSKNGKRFNVLTFDPDINYEPWRVYTPVASFSIGEVKKLICNAGDGYDNVTISHTFKKRCTLLGDTGNDELYGGSGNDIIHGGPGSDRCDGEKGNDKVYGDEGADGCFGGLGRDTLDGGDDPDTMIGGPNDDLLITRDGHCNEYVNGNAGIDTLIGDRKGDDIETNFTTANIGADIEVLDLADAPD